MPRGRGKEPVIAATATPDEAEGGAGLSTTRDGWGLIRSTLRAQWKGVAFGVGVGLLWTVAKVTVPSLLEQAIDNGIAPAVENTPGSTTAGDLSALRFWSITIGGFAVMAALFTGLRRYWAFRESRMVEARLRDQLFAQIQRLHFAYHDRVQTGDLMSRSNTDLQQIQALVVLIPLTISNFVTVVSVSVILVIADWKLALLALGPLPLLNYLGKRFSTKLHPHVLGIQQESAQLAAVVEESVSGVRVVKGFGAQGVQARRLRAEADDVYDVSMAAARVRARYLPIMDLLPTAGFIVVLGIGGQQVIAGTLSIGELVAFNVYIAVLIWPLRMLGMIIAQGQRAAASAQRVHEVLATEPAIVEKPEPRSLPTAGGMQPGDEPGPGSGEGLGSVRFDGVCFAYHAGGDVAVLDHLELDIAAGESVALVGATGSGKSTVAKLLPRFYDVDEGAVLLDGVDVRDLRVVELRKAIGIVFEETFLFSDTIANNIAFADPDADDATIERAARLAGADEFIRDLPDGYATEVGERGFSLSGGQRQRLAIARAILSDPRVLILDDATSSVDPTKEHEIRDALAEVMRGRTTIVIAHRPATIALADRVVLLGDGLVFAEGTHDELLARSAAYRQVLAAAEARERGLAGDGDGSSSPPGAEPTGGPERAAEATRA